MDLLTRQHFKNLMNVTGEHCVSVYLPTHRTSRESRQDPIRFKNLLQTAKHTLEQRSVDLPTIRGLIAPAEEWLGDLDFWRHQVDGLAVFLTEDFQQRLRLPMSFDEQVRVDDHFYVNPLLPLLQGNGRFYVLAVSQQSCRLLAANRDTVAELDEATLPSDLQSALGWWRERELNLHSMQSKPQSRGGDDTAMYHGHYEDTTEEDLKAYFRKIDAAVGIAFRGERAPLVFAGVDYLFPIYRSVNTYPALCEKSVAGNPDDAPPAELHRKAWEIVRPLFETRERGLLDEFPLRASTGKATDDIATLLQAARDGGVETLIVAKGATLWGRFSPSCGLDLLDERESDAEDLLDHAARWTFQTSGDVLAVDSELMPGDSKAVALLRAPLSTIAN